MPTTSVPITWSAFAELRPDLAAIGRDMLYEVGVGLGFLATVRTDGGPRVHPVSPIFLEDGLYVMVIPGPKLGDLRRDSRYALHSLTYPPPREDDGFYLSGRVVEIYEEPLITAIGDRFLEEREGAEKWPGFDDQGFFEILLDRALLTLTLEREGFEQGSTIWKAG